MQGQAGNRTPESEDFRPVDELQDADDAATRAKLGCRGSHALLPERAGAGGGYITGASKAMSRQWAFGGLTLQDLGYAMLDTIQLHAPTG